MHCRGTMIDGAGENYRARDCVREDGAYPFKIKTMPGPGPPTGKESPAGQAFMS